MKTPAQQIPAIPQNLTGEELVIAMNDRLRRINGLVGNTTIKQTNNNSVTIDTPGGSATITPPGVFGTHVARLATPLDTYPTGTFFFELDRTVLYQLQPSGGGSTWAYISGTMADLLANKPGDLGATDVNFLFRATNYARVWRWTGSVWTRAPGERPTREFIYAAEAPGTGWQLCDGSAAITYTKDDATTSTMTMPNETAGTYRKGGVAYASGTNAGTLPGLSGSTAAVSAGTPAGTNSAPTLTMNSYTPAGTNSVPTFTGSAMATHQHEESYSEAGGFLVSFANIFGIGAGTRTPNTRVAVGAFNTATFCSLTSAVSAGTPAGTVTAPTFTGTPAVLTGTVTAPTFTGSALGTHSHGAGTLALASIAEPNNVVMLPYMKL